MVRRPLHTRAATSVLRAGPAEPEPGRPLARCQSSATTEGPVLANGILTGEPRFKGSFLRNHSLSIALIALLVMQSVVFHFTELPDWTSDAQAHGGSTALWPAYWLHYTAEWFVSVLADTYGALLLVLFSKWFFEQGSAESEGSRGKRKEEEGS